MKIKEMKIKEMDENKCKKIYIHYQNRVWLISP